MWNEEHKTEKAGQKEGNDSVIWQASEWASVRTRGRDSVAIKSENNYKL